MMPSRAHALPTIRGSQATGINFPGPPKHSLTHILERCFVWTFWLVFSLSAHALVISSLIALYLTYSTPNKINQSITIYESPMFTAGDERTQDTEQELLAPEQPIEPDEPVDDPEPIDTVETPPDDVGQPDDPDNQDLAELDPVTPIGAGISNPTSDLPASGDLGDGLVASGEFTEVLGDLRTRGLEVVFMFDATGSMNSHLRQAKKKILFLMEVIDTLVPKNRIGIGAYRDEGEQYVVHKGLTLSTDKKKIFRYMKTVSAEGGRDEPEAVADAMLWAIEENKWSPQAHKVIVFIADAQGHKGRIYDQAVTRMQRFTKQERGQVNALITCAPSRLKPGTGYYRAYQFFEEFTHEGGGQVLTFDKEEELTKQMLILAFGREWEDDLDSLYKQAIEIIDSDGHHRKFTETPAQLRARYIDVLGQADPGKRVLEEALQGLAAHMEKDDAGIVFPFIDHKDDTVSYFAVKALFGRTYVSKDHIAEAISRQLVNRPESMFWVYYAKRLTDLKSQSAVDSLVQVLETMDDPNKQSWAASTLKDITGENFGKNAKRWRTWAKNR